MAHKLKSADKLVGAYELAHHCEITEYAARDKKIEEVQTITAMLPEVMTQVDNEIKKIIS